MQLASERTSLRKRWFRLLALGALLVLIRSAAHAQNLDQGKSAAKLFGDSCATCHRSARGLAKGLSSHALLVPARALREQFQLGLGAHLLSGIRR
jgi:mono/diheme cytochrome c family protein